MPIFRCDLERTVSRVVELRQTTSVLIEAPDLMAANDAARSLAEDDELDQYASEWLDDNASRLASNDEEVARPRLERSHPCGMVLGGPIFNAMPEEETQS